VLENETFQKSTYTPDLTQGEKKKSYLKMVSLQQKGLKVKVAAKRSESGSWSPFSKTFSSCCWGPLSLQYL